MTLSHVMGCGLQKGHPEFYRGVEVEPTLLPKVQLDVVVSKVPVRRVIETAKKVLYTGNIGDGKIFVYDVENVVKVRTGEEGYDALQDVEQSFVTPQNYILLLQKTLRTIISKYQSSLLSFVWNN